MSDETEAEPHAEGERIGGCTHLNQWVAEILPPCETQTADESERFHYLQPGRPVIMGGLSDPSDSCGVRQTQTPPVAGGVLVEAGTQVTVPQWVSSSLAKENGRMGACWLGWSIK
jgi:hypothetical protein